MLLENDASQIPPAKEESANSIEPSPHAAKRRGRRPSHSEQWTKVTVVLMDRQIVFLDRLVADIRAANGASISRANLIRALVDALAQSDIDLTSSRSERDLRQVLSARLHREKVAS